MRGATGGPCPWTGGRNVLVLPALYSVQKGSFNQLVPETGRCGGPISIVERNQALVLMLTSNASLGKSCTFSGPPFPH